MSVMTYIFFASFCVMFLTERIFRRQAWPETKLWLLRAFLFTSLQILVVWLLGKTLDKWLESRQFFSILFIGEFWGTVAAFLLMTFVSYWQHRIKHIIPFLWCWLHQVHHSPRRIELMTSFYRNPFEIIFNMVIMSTVLYIIAGANAEIALNAVILLGLADMFYHWNIKTPFWLGYIIQRPESHCLHHLTGVHAYNYGDIVIWDMLFGTFKNLRAFSGKCGFAPGKENEITKMLTGHDMSDGGYLRSHKKSV